MPANKKRQGRSKSRRERRPNVYVQDDNQTKSAISLNEPTNQPQTSENADRVLNRSRRMSEHRGVVRHNIARGEVYTRMVPKELKKFGILTAVATLTLIILTFSL